MAQAGLGLPSTVGKTVPVEAPVSTRMWADGFYVRDQWQATRNLTVTFGVRYELYPIPTRAHRGLELAMAHALARREQSASRTGPLRSG